MKEIVSFLKDWLDYWRDYFGGLKPAKSELDGHVSLIAPILTKETSKRGDTPIYDQLEREWVKDGKLPHN
jgi:hypothetical protein